MTSSFLGGMQTPSLPHIIMSSFGYPALKMQDPQKILTLRTFDGILTCQST